MLSWRLRSSAGREEPVHDAAEIVLEDMRFNRWHLEHAGGTNVVLAMVVLALGFAILLTV